MNNSEPTSNNMSPYNEEANTENPASAIGEKEINLTADNFESEILNYKGIAMVDFFSPTCPHCQKIGPIISEIALEYGDVYKIGKLNADENLSIAIDFEINSVPTLVFFKDGKEVSRLKGEKPKEEIIKELESIK